MTDSVEVRCSEFGSMQCEQQSITDFNSQLIEGGPLHRASSAHLKNMRFGKFFQE